MGTLIKQRLAEGKVLWVFGIGQLCHPKLVEMIGQKGDFDAIWLDQEHVGLTIPQLEEASRAARSVGLDSFARLNCTDYASVMQPLEAGVGGIMAAQVRNAKEAADIVQWAKFHPLGLRGVNGTGVDGRYGTLKMDEYFQKANDDTFIAIQIENAEAVEDVEKIAGLPAVDVLFIGPADLSQSLGIPGQWDNPKLWQSIERVANAAAAKNIHWAILPLSPDFAKKCVSLGCKMLSVGMDVWTFQSGLKSFAEMYQEVKG